MAVEPSWRVTRLPSRETTVCPVSPSAKHRSRAEDVRSLRVVSQFCVVGVVGDALTGFPPGRHGGRP